MTEQAKPYRGKAAFHLFELDQMLAPTVVRNLTRQAVALREEAVRAKTKAERDALRFEAEGVFIEARKEIRKIYGDTERGDDIEATADAALSAIAMP